MATSPSHSLALLLVVLVSLPAAAVAQIIGPETRVSTVPALDFEPAIAAVGNKVVAVWSRDRAGLVGSSYSNDGGQTWSEGGALIPPQGVTLTVAMPSICADSSGVFYAAALVESNVPPGGQSVAVWRGLFSENQFTWQTGTSTLPLCPPVHSEFTILPCYDMPSIACDPATGDLYLTATLAEDYSYDDIRTTIHFVRSLDGGQSWSVPEALSTTSSNGARVAVGSNGEVFVVWVDFLAGQVVGKTSLDGGNSFGSQVGIAPFINNLGSGPPEYRMLRFRQNPIFGYCHWHGAAAQDFPSLAVDRSNGPRSGTFYIAWAERAAGTVSVGTLPVPEQEPNHWFATADSIEIGQDVLGRIEGEGFGDPDIFFFDGTAGSTLWLRAEIQFANSFSDAPPCNTFNVYCADDTLHRLANGTMQEAYRGFLPPVILTLPKTGRYFIYVNETDFTNDYVLHPRVFTPDPASTGRDHRDIVMVSSIDGGATWSPKVLVNDDPPRFDNSFPEIAVDAVGTVHAIWYDRRDDLSGRHANTYWSCSMDGAAFSPGRRLSSQSSPWNYGIPGGSGSNIGDHMGLAVSGERVHVLWTQRGRPDVDIYSVTIAPDVVGIAVSNFTAAAGAAAIDVSWRMEDPTLATQFIVHRTDSFRNEVEAIAKIDPNVHQREYAFADRMAALGVTYEYRLELMGRSGESDWFGPVTARLPWPTQLRWISYQPNPFQHTTQLTLVGLPNEPTSVSVFDVAGRRVRELLQEASPSGITRLRWDGTDDLGNPARAGMYIVHALQGGRSATAKILKIP